MAIQRDHRSNFSSGLLSEGMQGRRDLAAYNNGCRELLNWWPLVTGGVRRRPGSMYLNEILYSGNTLNFRIEPFVFNESQRFLCVFHRYTVTIFNGDTGLPVYEITTTNDPDVVPWFNVALNQMSVAQLGDTMFIAHPSFQTRILKRTAVDTFTLSLYEFEKSPTANTYPHFAPFSKFASPEVTLTPSSTDFSVTFVASAPVFDSSYVGRLMRYRGKQFVCTGFINTTTIVGDVKEELASSTLLTFGGPGSFNSGGNAKDFIIGEIIVGRDTGIKAEVISHTGNNGIQVASLAGDFGTSTVNEAVEGLDSGNIMSFTNRTKVSPAPHANWDEIAFSDDRGWPGVVAFHSQRLWFGGSSSLPAHIFGSKAAAFFNFNVGEGFPDESIQVLIADEQISNIVDMVSGNHLLIFTDAAEFYAPESDDQPLTPETFNVLPQTRFGIKPGTRAKRLDEGTIFIQSNGTAVREFIWSDRARRYTSDAISLLSEEAINDVQEITVLYGGYERPEHIAFFRNKERDGFVSWYHTARAEQIRAWGIWDTDKTPSTPQAIVDASVNPPVQAQSSQNTGYYAIGTLLDKLYAVSVRHIFDVDTGQYESKAFLERFELNATMDLQGPLTQATVVEQSVFTGLHLALRNLDIAVTTEFGVGDGVNITPPDHYMGHFVLDDLGTLDLDNVNRFNVQVGLTFTQVLTPMSPEVDLPDGASVGMPKRIVSVDVKLKSTMHIKIGGKESFAFNVTQDFSVKPVAKSGNVKFYPDLGYDEEPTVTLFNDIPLPCEVSSLSMEIDY